MTSIKIRNVEYEGEVGRLLKEELTNEFTSGFILVGDEEVCLPETYAKFAERIRTFKVRDSDILVASYPKTGTTWTQEMVWLIANDYNFEGANSDIRKRFPFIEACTLWDKDLARNKYKGEKFHECSIDVADRLESPRFMKSHLPFSLYPDEIKNGEKRPKIIYIVRNPKDACVSYYHHGTLFDGWTLSLESYAKVFLADRVRYGSFWKHALGFWAHRNEPNFLFLTYEDMKKDLPSVIQKVAKFLGKTVNDDNMKQLCKHLSFESMQKNDNLNYSDFVEFRKKHNLPTSGGNFIRAGVVGKFKEEMPPETIAEFDKWIKKNTAGTSFHEYYNYSV